nr:hypothetical protein [Haladaptatus salinisoli]
MTTLGYSLLAGSVGLPFGLGGVVLTLLTMPDAEAPFVDPVTSVGGLLGIAIAFVALSGLFTGIMAAFSVAFYREIRVPTSG